MNCPIDGTTLVMTERQGVEIDYCPSCRGVWLDRGELDKILERSGEVPTPGPPPAPAQPAYDPRYGDRPDPRRSYDDDRRRDGYREGQRGEYRDQYGRPRKKKEGWLGEIFDF